MRKIPNCALLSFESGGCVYDERRQDEREVVAKITGRYSSRVQINKGRD